MTAESKAAVLTARRAAQHIRLFEPNDAYECLCILTVLPEPSPVSALCWQIHRRLAVLMPLLRVWVHCPRASNGLLPRRSNLVGYVQWGARFDRFLLCQTIMSSSFPGRSLIRFSISPRTQYSCSIEGRSGPALRLERGHEIAWISLPAIYAALAMTRRDRLQLFRAR
jgi:hypothetical protein